MSAITVNLIQGSAAIYVAASSATLPVASDITALLAGTFTGFASVGHTTSAVKLTDTPSFVEATSQQSTRTVAMSIKSWETEIETTCREFTLENIRRAMHGVIASSVVNPGASNTVEVLKYALVGPWTDGDTILVTVEFGVVTSGFNLAFDRDNFSDLPLKIKVLEGTSLAAGYKVTIIS